MNATGQIKTDKAADRVFPEQFAYVTADAPALKARQIGLVPGAEVPLLSVTLPGALRGHAREQVAERQMRDALASGQDVIEVRPFHTPDQDREWGRVLVADRARLSDWRRLAGKNCRAVLPDYLALPTGPGLWTLAQSHGTILARLGPQDGFSAPPAVALRLLKDALNAASPAPGAIYCIGPQPTEIEALFEAHSLPLVRDEAGLQALNITPPRRLAHGELSFDLRRDPRAARAELRAALLPWRWPVLVAGLAACLWAGAQMLAIDGLQDQINQTRAATLETVRADFVPTGPVLDIRTQVTRALAEARVAATGAGEAVSPLDLLGLAADVMTARGAQPDYIDYTLADGLRTVVRVENFAAADDLAAALSEAGLAITVVESRVSEADDGVRTELRIAAPDRNGDDG